MEKIRIGISACLLGQNVRYDGGHQLDRFLRDTLGYFVDYVPVCPEVEMGLPIPRQTLRLVGDADSPRLVFSKSGEDVTERMTSWAKRRLAELEKEDLCGFIFKARSPSSGMARVKLYDRRGVPNKNGVGLFARLFMEYFPMLPVEEDGRLNDIRLRENFIEAIFTFRRWRDFLTEGATPEKLVAFHARHKLLLMSHSVELARQMGRLVGRAGEVPAEEILRDYKQLLMQAVRTLTTPAKHSNVLQHALGYFKRQLSHDEKQEMLQLIDQYRHGTVPLAVPLALLNHYVRKYQPPWLDEQVYLHPHPMELHLRSGV
ncbi:protein of unknown function, DUF523 and DUF1722 [Syntrophotalea carbinolica DSM 2380]|uniref:DUF1722 domain-containing protein n=1 Tax=Syntrophotalea carbinolica (strain DSM 2380 / NBRC 103641 / GraBd1) TaxID=338963 RepID=Q3A109_SYNC1|nr:DUF523 and DUF1722 domain-containing protein [Syntrophotalea carbinolica]ABA89948.1 protein of unknown function, DUF523 and DUF1722 [Syntrophotalea carbinolica DSM 2380]